jgi:hypothetical protein
VPFTASRFGPSGVRQRNLVLFLEMERARGAKRAQLIHQLLKLDDYFARSLRPLSVHVEEAIK